MSIEQDEDTRLYKVVVNHEEQYALWPIEREVPAGWRDAGKQGFRAECLAFIRGVWTDMRPLSARQRREPEVTDAIPSIPALPEEPSLVERLSTGLHPVEFRSVPDGSLAEFRARVQQGYVHVRFTGTRGGTELGFRLDRRASDFSGADLDVGKGKVRLVGSLTLDYVRVQCIATLDLPSLTGVGTLRPEVQSTDRVTVHV